MMGVLRNNAALIGIFLFTLSVTVEGLKDYPREKEQEHRKNLRSQHSPKTLFNEASVRAEGDDLRLPTNLVPSSEVIRLQPIIGGNFSTYGYVEIIFDCVEATDVVMFHMYDIITRNETIKLVDTAAPSVELTFLRHEYNLTKEVYIGTVATPLEVGKSYSISMEFEGYLTDYLGGFYRSSYKDDNGKDVLLATTSMEPVDARRAFPCFDEPDFKVNFTISMLRQLPRTTISNMPLVSSNEDPEQPGWYWDVFETSPKMSSYLVAFVVSDFVHIERLTNDERILFRIWARDSAIDQADYALENGPDILSFYEDYYKVPYPLPKQDMIAIPDFSSGAMENWGLITYREIYLLYDPVETDAYTKESVDKVMAHELAHMWFGDLVTMAWWTDLWLNEGFASYMEYQGTNNVSSEYDCLNEFTYNDVQYAMLVDSLESSHPIYVDVNTPSEINSIFDTITYSKGSSVIRMMRFFLTDDTFKAALTNYLTKHAYDNARQDDLWSEMDAQAHIDGTLDASMNVTDIMNTWTLQVGYPVVDVVINGDGTAILTQNRFLQHENSNVTNYMWWIPLTWTSSDNPQFAREGVDGWMSNSERTKFVVGLPTTASWFILNVDETGFYRVSYETSNWQALSAQLATDHTVMSILARSQLIDDVMNLAKAVPARVDYPVAFDLLSYLKNETDMIPWKTALYSLLYVENMFTDNSGYSNLKLYLLDLLTPLYDFVGFDDSLQDPFLTQITRSVAVDWTCHLDDNSCVNNAIDLYAQWMADSTINPVSPNLRESVYCTAIANGGEEEWNFAWAQYKQTDVASEVYNLIAAMGCSRKSNVLIEYLDLTYKTNGSFIKSSDSYRVWSAVSYNDYGNNVAFDYLNNNWDAMEAYFGSYVPLGGMMNIVAAEYNTPLERQELVLFSEARADDLGPGEASVASAIERTDRNIAWMDLNYDDIEQWLIDQGFVA